jgi:hypothetical protein
LQKDLPLETLTVFKHLRAVAHKFILAQEKREEIREEPVAQAYLVSLLGIRPRSE